VGSSGLTCVLGLWSPGFLHENQEHRTLNSKKRDFLFSLCGQPSGWEKDRHKVENENSFFQPPLTFPEEISVDGGHWLVAIKDILLGASPKGEYWRLSLGTPTCRIFSSLDEWDFLGPKKENNGMSPKAECWGFIHRIPKCSLGPQLTVNLVPGPRRPLLRARNDRQLRGQRCILWNSHESWRLSTWGAFSTRKRNMTPGTLLTDNRFPLSTFGLLRWGAGVSSPTVQRREELSVKGPEVMFSPRTLQSRDVCQGLTPGVLCLWGPPVTLGFLKKTAVDRPRVTKVPQRQKTWACGGDTICP